MKFIASKFYIITICLLIFLTFHSFFMDDTPWLLVIPAIVLAMRIIKWKHDAKQK